MRIKLRADELQQHPLRLGLSMLVTVDVSTSDGPLLTAAKPKATLATTQSLNVDLRGADRRVAGSSPKTARPIEGWPCRK